jgi:rhodanese-related sulfurtransferase
VGNQKEVLMKTKQGIGLAFLPNVLLLLLTLFLTSCSQTATTGAAVQSISPQAYQEQFGTSDAEHFLLDVRTPEEFASGHIAGAINIAVDALEQHLSEVPKDQPVIVYCHSGNRSAQATQILQNAGYSQIYDLGGVVQWQQAGYALQ